jgi:rhomboid family GlyGly-CTERM serine protease
LAHYSFDHFFWDLSAFGLLGLACERRSRARFLVCVTISAVAIALAVWFVLPGMTAYRGLSGVDSALFALLCVELWTEGVRSRRPTLVAGAAACLTAFLFKISFELLTGHNLFVETLESGTVGVPLAHVVGATVGFLVGLGIPHHARRGEKRGTTLRDASVTPKIPAAVL